jgi:hypothetical protein
MGFCSFVHWPKVGGTCGDTYFTTSSISTGGDSGAAAIDNASNMVGTVIGGTAGYTTYIQDVRYQLAQAAHAVTPASSLPGLTV